MLFCAIFKQLNRLRIQAKYAFVGNIVLSELVSLGAFDRTISTAPRRDRLHIMPTSTGYGTATSPTYNWDGRRRGQTPFSVLQHTISGQGRLMYDRRSYQVGPGETMLVIIPDNHRYWIDAGERWEFFWITMTGQEAMRLHRAILSTVGPVFTLRPHIVERIAKCCLDLADGPEYPGEASMHAYSATMALYDALLEPQKESERLTPRHVLTGRVVKYVREHLDAQLTVQGLADYAGLSRAHFSRIFSQEEGMSPADFIASERMRRAARLLGGSTKSVKAIADSCGFHDSNYFSKAFRNSYGVSPSEFRSTGMYSTLLEATRKGSLYEEATDMID